MAISQVVLRVPATLKGVFALLYPDKLILIVQSRGGFLEKEVVLLYRNTPCVVIGEDLQGGFFHWLRPKSLSVSW